MYEFDYSRKKRIAFENTKAAADRDQVTFKDYIEKRIGINKAREQITKNNHLDVKISESQFHNERRGCGYFTPRENMDILLEKDRMKAYE